MSEHDFRSSTDGDKKCYNLYVFDIRYQKIFESTKPIKIQPKFSVDVPASIYG